jgi:hypothetical protein
MTYYNKLEPYDRELWIIYKTGTISAGTKSTNIMNLIKIYENHYKKKVKLGCGKCSGRALRKLADDYQILKNEPIENLSKPLMVSAMDVETVYEGVKYQELRRLCRSKNIPLDKKDKKQDLIDKLNNHE